MASSSVVWISYDLGVRGDYESLYNWLDEHNAKECGDALAVIEYDHTESLPLPEQLKADLKRAIAIDKRTRIYIVYRDRETNKNKGVFLFGGRRAPVWTGYAASKADNVDVEA